MKNIVLVGFMGTGKTLTGKLLAGRLNRKRISLDEMIEKKAGQAISDIFSRHGEEYFRRLEKDIVNSLPVNKSMIIDAGGGVVIDEDNVKRLKQGGVIICLKARPEVIYERTKSGNSRPLLNTPDPVKSIKELLAARASFYDRADYSIDTSDLTPDEVVNEILNVLKI
ncbi:MAG: shikimate kinase [Candidatus Omnitrophica bacterium]|jgi:shikimate kinase|nr:shikimate kinase [Candidatus Omnitrophota bacterium]